MVAAERPQVRHRRIGEQHDHQRGLGQHMQDVARAGRIDQARRLQRIADRKERDRRRDDPYRQAARDQGVGEDRRGDDQKAGL
jgi:hypothetical protein